MADELIHSPEDGELITAGDLIKATRAEIERLNNDPQATLADFDRLTETLDRFKGKPAPVITRA